MMATAAVPGSVFVRPERASMQDRNAQYREQLR